MAISTSPSEKVVITPLEGQHAKVRYKAQFNPKELQIDKTVSWTPANAHQEDPNMEYKEPQSSQLQCTLYYDTFEEGTDCYLMIKPLEELAQIDETISHPPLCMFSWGTFNFTGVVSSLSQKYTMFSSTGARLRCEVALTMQSASKAMVSVDPKQS